MRTNQIIEDKTTEVCTEETIKVKIMREVGIDLEKGNIQKMSEGMTEVAVVDLDQSHKLVQIETGSDAINVENMISLLKTV